MFICFQHWKKEEGEATFNEEREENLRLGKKVGNFHDSQQLLSMIVSYTLLLVQGRILKKDMAFYVPIGCEGSQAIVVKCTATIFFRTVDSIVRSDAWCAFSPAVLLCSVCSVS